MSELQDFLNDNIDYKAEEKIVVSDRFQKDGKLLKFTVRSLTDSEIEEITNRCKKYHKKKQPTIDNQKLIRLMAIEGCVEPKLKDAESLKKVGTLDPEVYIQRVLLPGEIAILSEKIMEISGFQDTEELKEEAKNL